MSDAELASVDQTPVSPDVFAECMRQLSLVYDTPPMNEEKAQAYLDLFREDQWLNRHLRFACKWLVRNQTKMPVYADFMRWRKSEDGPDYAG